MSGNKRPVKGKRDKRKSKNSASDDIEEEIKTIFRNVARRLATQESLEVEAGHAILAFLQGNAARRLTPQLASNRQRIYERTKSRLELLKKSKAAVVVQTSWRGHRAREVHRPLLQQSKEAALVLQRNFRGFLARKRVRALREERAAVAIQRHQRGRAARQQVNCLRLEKQDQVRHRAAVTIQRHVRGWLTRCWYVKYYDTRACCTCNSLADSEVLICDDCYEVYHLACAGYRSDFRPAPDRPWYCHFCVASKARHTVFVQRRRPNATQSLVRIHCYSEADFRRLQEMVAAPESVVSKTNERPNTALPRIIPLPKKHRSKLDESTNAKRRLSACRAETEKIALKSERLRQKVETLKAEAHSSYLGPPPPAASAQAKHIPAKPVLDFQAPESIAPTASPDNGLLATSESVKGKQRLHQGKRAKSKKRPVLPRDRLMDPLHPRQPAFPAYSESREELFRSGVFNRRGALALRASMEQWKDSLFGLDAIEQPDLYGWQRQSRFPPLDGSSP